MYGSTYFLLVLEFSRDIGGPTLGLTRVAKGRRSGCPKLEESCTSCRISHF